MKKLLFLFALLICQSLSANTINDYFKLINEAELLICQGDPEAASNHYQKAFNLDFEPFGKDIYNAWLCAYRLDDTTKFIQYSSLLIRRGAFLHSWSHEDFLNQVDPSKTKSYSAIWTGLKARIPAQIDTIYRALLQNMRNSDQSVRKYFVNQCKESYNICGKDSLNKFDSINVLSLKALIQKKGFPIESIVGFESAFPANSPFYDIVLLHDRSWNNRQTMDTLLYHAVKIGALHPQHYALLKDQSYGSFQDSVSLYQDNTNSIYGTSGIYVIGDKVYLSKIINIDSKKIDSSRADIYLETIMDMYSKCSFQFRNPAYHFLDFKYFMSFDDFPDQIKEKIISKSYPQNEINGFNSIRLRRCEYGLRH